MKVKVTESQLATYFNEVIKEMDMCSCEESVLNEALTPTDKSDVKTMVNKQLNKRMVNEYSAFFPRYGR